MKKEKLDWMKHTQGAMEVLGFWTEDRRSGLIKSMERSFVDDILREWLITDIIINGEKVLLKWAKRHIPLTDAEIREQYRK